jgi:hypothetical protein
MAFLNRVGFETSTSGTGSVSVGAAVSGYATPVEAGAVNGISYPYVIEDGTDFEVGYGTYSSSGPTLSRDTVYLSKIGGTAGTTKLTLSGSAKVYFTATAEDLSAIERLFYDDRMQSLEISDLRGSAWFSGPDGSAIHDHFDSLTYVDVGGATNLDTSEAGCLKPSVAVTTTLANTSLAANQTGFTNYNHRMRVAGSQLSANGSAFRLTLAGVSSGTAAAISGMYAGHKAAAGDAYDFDGTQVQVKVGGNASFSVAAGATVVTDWITYAFDETKDFVVAFHTTSGDIRCRVNTDTTNYDWWTKTGATEVSTANASGYSQSVGYDFGLVSLIEVQSGLSNVSVRSQAISAAEQPETMRALVLLHDAVGITLNTDTLVDLSRDGGTTWATATLVELYTQPGNVRVLDTGNVDVSGQPAGSSMRWRWRTANAVAAKNLGVAMWGTA